MLKIPLMPLSKMPEIQLLIQGKSYTYSVFKSDELKECKLTYNCVTTHTMYRCAHTHVQCLLHSPENKLIFLKLTIHILTSLSGQEQPFPVCTSTLRSEQSGPSDN